MKSVKHLLILVCFSISMMTQAQVKLSFNPEVGKTYLYETKTDLVMKMIVMGQEVPIKTFMKWEYELKVTSKTADEVALQFAYKHLVINFSMPTMNVTIDSKNDNPQASEEAKAINKMLGGIVGKTFDVVFANDGSVKKLTGMTEILESMLKLLPEDATSTQMTKSLLQSMNDENVKISFEQAFRIYPTQPVKVGDSWSIDSPMSISMMSSGDIENTYTLKSILNNRVTLGISSVINVGQVSGLEVNLKGNQTGELVLDQRTGLPVKSEISNTIKGSVVDENNPMTMDISSKTNLTLLAN